MVTEGRATRGSGEPTGPWWIRMGAASVRIDLRCIPALDRRFRRFVTADVQRDSADAVGIDSTDAVGIDGADGTPPEARFELVATRDPVPPAPDDTFFVDDMQASWSLDGIWVETPSGVLVGGGADGRYRLHVGPDGQIVAYEPVMALLGHVGARMGWNSLHSALIHSPVGALLLIGQSGRGKSTTSGTALHLGWAVDSDDVTFLRLGRERSGPGSESQAGSGNGSAVVEAMGFPRVLSVPDEAVPAALLDGASVGLDYRSRRSVRRFDRRGGWHPVVAVIEVDHGVEPGTRFEEISPLEVVQGMVRNQAIAGAIPGQDRALAVLMGRLTRVPAVRLALGTDASARVASTAASLVELCEQVRAAAPDSLVGAP